MGSLLTRLQHTRLAVISPKYVDPRTYPQAIPASSPEYARRLTQIKHLRMDDTDRRPSNDLSDSRDEISWHIICIREASDSVCGALRIRHYQADVDSPSPADILRSSDIPASDIEICKSIQEALVAYVDDHLAKRRDFCTIGRLIVAPSSRGSSLATILILATYAWLEMMDLGGGCFLAPVDAGLDKFYQRFGGFPLGHGAHPLPILHSSHHIPNLRLMVMESERYPERHSGTVAAIRETAFKKN